MDGVRERDLIVMGHIGQKQPLYAADTCTCRVSTARSDVLEIAESYQPLHAPQSHVVPVCVQPLMLSGVLLADVRVVVERAES